MGDKGAGKSSFLFTQSILHSQKILEVINMKKKNSIFIIVGICILAILTGLGGYYLGNKNAISTINSSTYTLEGINTEINNQKKQSENITNEIKENEKELASITNEYMEAKILAEQKTDLENSISNLSSQKDNLSKELDQLNLSISENKKELEKLVDGIVLLELEPIELRAGNFTVGEHINKGRYLVTPVDTGSYGNLELNDYDELVTFDKNSNYGVQEYILNLKDGDTIKMSTPLIFTQIEE